MGNIVAIITAVTALVAAIVSLIKVIKNEKALATLKLALQLALRK